MSHAHRIILALAAILALTGPLAAQSLTVGEFPPQPSEFPAPAVPVSKDTRK